MSRVSCSSPIASCRVCRSRGAQTIIIMLGVMAFALVVGLAISSRVVTSIRQAAYSTQSAESLAYAEGGIEYALRCIKDSEACGQLGSTVSLDMSGDENLNSDGVGENECTYTITSLSSSSYFDALSPIDRDKTVQIDLSGYTGSTVDVFWVDRSDASERHDQAAMEVSVVYLSDEGVYRMRRCAFDPVASRRASNHLTTNPTPDTVDYCTQSTGFYPVGGVNYQNRIRISIPAGASPSLLRLRALYNEVANSFAVKAPWEAHIPAQGLRISSLGSSGRVRRRVEVVYGSPALSELFDYVLYSGDETNPLSK